MSLQGCVNRGQKAALARDVDEMLKIYWGNCGGLSYLQFSVIPGCHIHVVQASGHISCLSQNIFSSYEFQTWQVVKYNLALSLFSDPTTLL